MAGKDATEAVPRQGPPQGGPFQGKNAGRKAPRARSSDPDNPLNSANIRKLSHSPYAIRQLTGFEPDSISDEAVTALVQIASDTRMSDEDKLRAREKVFESERKRYDEQFQFESPSKKDSEDFSDLAEAIEARDAAEKKAMEKLELLKVGERAAAIQASRIAAADKTVDQLFRAPARKVKAAAHGVAKFAKGQVEAAKEGRREAKALKDRLYHYGPDPKPEQDAAEPTVEWPDAEEKRGGAAREPAKSASALEKFPGYQKLDDITDLELRDIVEARNGEVQKIQGDKKRQREIYVKSGRPWSDWTDEARDAYLTVASGTMDNDDKIAAIEQLFSDIAFGTKRRKMSDYLDSSKATAIARRRRRLHETVDLTNKRAVAKAERRRQAERPNLDRFPDVDPVEEINTHINQRLSHASH